MRANGVSNATLYYTGEDYASFAWAPYVFDSSKAIAIDDPNLESRMMGISTEEMDAQNSVIIQRKPKLKAESRDNALLFSHTSYLSVF